MVLAPRDIPITRDHVWQWMVEYQDLCRDNPDYIGSWRDYVSSRVKFMNIPDEMVNTSEMENWDENETNVIEMILADMQSYG